MIIKYVDVEKVIDTRHTICTKNSTSFALAVQVNADGTFEDVIYMTDDSRTWNNEVICDATTEEVYSYRKLYNKIEVGDKVQIVKGRKMVGEIKVVKDITQYTVPNTYGKVVIDYLVFTDNTKVNKLNCELV